MNYEQLCQKSLTNLTEAELEFCLTHELDRNDLTSLADTTSEFDRRHGTALRQYVADANNALMHLSEEMKMAAFGD